MNTNFKIFKPLTPSLRATKLLKKTDLLQNIKPVKTLTKGFNKSYGRNNKGILTNWNKGGGHLKLYRKIDFSRQINSLNFGIVEGFEYDPNRSANIIRVFNPDYHKHSYILRIKTLISGCLIKNYINHKIGDHTYLKNVPSGYLISNLSSGLNKSGKYLRAAGTYGQILFRNSELTKVKLRSGEHRIFPTSARATIGSIGNENYRFIKLGKAGRNRWHGKRPTVRGVAINPVDHPHGGGEGKTSGGRSSVTPWGKPTKNERLLKRVNKIQVKLK